MSERLHKRNLTRILWLLNHADDDEAWLLAADGAGYEVDVEMRGGFPVKRGFGEARLSYDGRVVAIVHQFFDEAFAFLWVPEARCPLWRRLLWRVRHPATRKTDLPWPRRWPLPHEIEEPIT